MRTRSPGRLIGLLILGGLAGACVPVEDRRQAEAGAQAEAMRLAQAQSANPPFQLFFEGTVGNIVYFDTGSHALRADARRTLDRQAEWLRANPEFSAVAEGYADLRGPRGYNHPLAARRATAVRDYLISRGVSSTQIVDGVTFGEESPARDCETPQCLAENRRVVTVVTSAQVL